MFSIDPSPIPPSVPRGRALGRARNFVEMLDSNGKRPHSRGADDGFGLLFFKSDNATDSIDVAQT